MWLASLIMSIITLIVGILIGKNWERDREDRDDSKPVATPRPGLIQVIEPTTKPCRRQLRVLRRNRADLARSLIARRP